MCLIIFTTRAFDVNKEYLFNDSSYDKLELGKNLIKYWFITKFNHNPEELIIKFDLSEDWVESFPEEIKKEFKKLKKAGNKQKQLIKKIIREKLKENLNNLKYNKLNVDLLFKDDRWHHIYRIRGANVFAYYHLPSDFKGDKNEFIKALYNDIKEIIKGRSLKEVIFILHDRDLGEKKDNYRIPEPRSEQLKNSIGVKENVEFYAFQHSPHFSGIHGLLTKFPWDNFHDEPDKIAAYIKKQLPALDCKKKLYELKEELLLNLYPVIFLLENENEKPSLPDSLVEKINNFIDKKELFADCDYRENAESVFLDIKEKLEMLLNKTADELIQIVAVKDSPNSKENKYLIIPEYFRAKFDELLILYKENEPIY